MLMREYLGKAIFETAGLVIPESRLIHKKDAENAMALTLPFDFPIAVKAQVRSGQRGKLGGVLRCTDIVTMQSALRQLFGADFDGEQTETVLLEPWLDIERELYIAVTIDGRADGYTLLYSSRGGTDVEDGPPLVRYPFGLADRFRTHEFRAILAPIEEDIALRERVLRVAEALVRIASMYDCKTVEINPLAQLPNGFLIALDAKIERDEWAAPRHADIMEEISQETKKESIAVQRCIAMGHMYIRLPGDIGIVSGGAGMTMAVMDMINEHGGSAACFLDCSSGPITADGYSPAFEMLDADLHVKAILVSIFGGGTQMQHVANAIRTILSTKKISKPIVFRLNGTNVDQATEILAEIGVQNIDSLEDAVATVVKLASKQ